MSVQRDRPRRGLERIALRITTMALLSIATVMPAAAAEHEIQAIRQRDHELMFFEPAFLRVEPGDRVTFVVDDLDHQPRSVYTPAGARPWEAEQGQSIAVSLDVPGVYIFECAFHNVMGMVGVLVVGEPHDRDDARAFFKRYRADTIRINRDRLEPVWERELPAP